MSTELLIDNTNLLSLSGLRNALTGDYLNGATVAASLKTVAGVDVEGMAWPVVLDYLPGSNGVYQTLLDGLTLIPRKQYALTLVAQGDGLTLKIEQFITATIRRD